MLIQVGTVGRPHGVRGQVKVRPETDDPSRFLDLASVYVGVSAEMSAEMAIASVALQPTKQGVTVLLGLEGVTSREAAEARRGDIVYARADDLPVLSDDEWYLDDMIGMKVRHADGDIGIVLDVLELPAHPTMAIRRTDGREALIPAVSPFVVNVDVAGGVIHVELPEGLLDV
jgi:16S rRNA processing protein RimM